MKVITVYRVISQGYGPYAYSETGIFRTREEAASFPGYHISERIAERKALELDDGRVWLLEDSGAQYFTVVESEKIKAALDKLTPEERKLLGIKE